MGRPGHSHACGDTESVKPGPGSDIAGHRLEQELGNGGTGTVYLATYGAKARRVALKLVNRDLSADPEFRRRFVEAAQLAGILRHPSVVPVLDYGETLDELLWMTMPFVDGADSDRLLRAGQMPPQRAVRLVSEVAGALDFVHSRRIVHGDVKPANFMVSQGSGSSGEDERALLVDFSLARRHGDRDPLGAAGMVLVSAAYASPEALRGQGLGGLADVYSLGCSLFRLLTGKPPFFDAGSKRETVRSHLQRVPPRATTFAPWLPEPIDEVIAIAMAKEPAARYPTASALARAARSALTPR